MSRAKMEFHFGKQPESEHDHDMDNEGSVSDVGPSNGNRRVTKGKPTVRRQTEATTLTEDESEEDIPKSAKKTGAAGSKAQTKSASKRKPMETPKAKAKAKATTTKTTTKGKTNTKNSSSSKGTDKGKEKPKPKPAEVESEESELSELSDSDVSDMADQPQKTNNSNQKGKKAMANKPEKPTKPLFAPTPSNNKASHLKRTLSLTELDDHEGRRAPAIFNRFSKAEGEHDPENHEIMRLREEERLSFGDIAQEINAQRVNRGRLPSLTESAIYSRYMRNAPLIAAAMGKEWEPVSLSKKPIGTGVTRPKPIKFTPEHDELLVRVYKEVVDETWKTVAERFEERGGPKFDAVTLARRYTML
ncbi:MAG: hypothetical protein M1823_002459 [Watsoniomyces obsoletus]|nr:MAG: hypothetical protein M1823_002459 [Watsoniomyces obsoletus]